MFGSIRLTSVAMAAAAAMAGLVGHAAGDATPADASQTFTATQIYYMPVPAEQARTAFEAVALYVYGSASKYEDLKNQLAQFNEQGCPLN